LGGGGGGGDDEDVDISRAWESITGNMKDLATGSELKQYTTWFDEECSKLLR
jgi:hypothetical protein